MDQHTQASDYAEPETGSLISNDPSGYDEITLSELFKVHGPAAATKKSLVTLSNKDSGDTARNQIYNVYQTLRKEGADHDGAVSEIMSHLPPYYGVDGEDRARDLRRSITDAEEAYSRYVGSGYKSVEVDLSKISRLDRMARTPRYKLDPDLVDSVAPPIKATRKSVTKALAKLRKVMGDTFSKDERTTETFLRNRYKPDELICFGETSMFLTATVDEVIAAGNKGLNKSFSTKESQIVEGGMGSSQLVASPMKSVHGTTLANRETMKSRSNCGPVKYVVFEVDNEKHKPSKEDSSSEVNAKLVNMMAEAIPKIRYLMSYAPVVDIIYSGSKSPHACFDVSEMSEVEVIDFVKLMMQLGGDAICRLPEQFFRMGGALRDTPRGKVRQSIYAIGRSNIHKPNDSSSVEVAQNTSDDDAFGDFDVIATTSSSKTAPAQASKVPSSIESSTQTPATSEMTTFLSSLQDEIKKTTVETWDRVVEATAEVSYANKADLVTVAQYLADQAKVIGKSYTKAEVKSLLNKHIKRISKAAHAVSQIPSWGRNYVFVADEDRFVNHRSFGILTPGAVDRSHLFDATRDGYEEPASRVLLQIEQFERCETMDFRPDRYDKDDVNGSRTFRDSSTGNQLTLNTFHELLYPERDKKKKNLKKVKKLIMRHLRNFLNEDDALLILDWIAYAVQQPGKRMSWMPVIQSAEGCGKGIIIALIRSVTTQSHISLVSPSAFHSDYSDYNEAKTVIGYDEFNMVDKRGVSAKDDFKNAITEEMITVNRKGGRMLDVPNIAKKIAFTNDLNCMSMSVTDRRFCMIKSYVQSESDVAKLNPAHFEEFCDAITDPNTPKHKRLNGAAREFLLEYDIRDCFDPLGRAPDTAYRAELIEESKSSEYRLLSQLLRDDTCLFVTDKFISVTQISSMSGCEWFDPKNKPVKEALNNLGFTKYDSSHGFVNAPKSGRVSFSDGSGRQTKHSLFLPLNVDKNIKFTLKGCDKSLLDFSYKGDLVENDFDTVT